MARRGSVLDLKDRRDPVQNGLRKSSPGVPTRQGDEGSSKFSCVPATRPARRNTPSFLARISILLGREVGVQKLQTIVANALSDTNKG